MKIRACKYFTCYLIFLCIHLTAQDTLLYRNGDRVDVKVMEVGTELIKYKKSANPEGPNYTVKKSEISYIKFAGGTIDTLVEIEKAIVGTPVEQEKKNRLAYSGTKIFYNSDLVTIDGLKKIINEHPDETRRKQMKIVFEDIERHQLNQSISLPVGLVLGCVTVIGTAPFVTGLTNGFLLPTQTGLQVAVVGILAGAAMRITAFTVSISQKNKQKAKIADLVVLYND